MARITRSKLDKIIKEEIEKVALDEGLLDTLGELGKGLQDLWKDAARRGDIKAADRNIKKGIEASINIWRNQRDKLRATYDIPGSPGWTGDEKVAEKMAELDGLIKGLERPGNTADAIVKGLADAADGEEGPEAKAVDKALDPYRDRALARVAALEKEEGGEEAKAEEPVPKAVQRAAITDPAEVLMLVLNFLNTVDGGKHQNLRISNLLNPKAVDRLETTIAASFRKHVQGLDSDVALDENKSNNIRVTRTALREAIRLLQENGI